MNVPRANTMHFEHRARSYPISYYFRPGHTEALLYFHGLGSSKDDFLGAWEVPEWTGYALLAFDAPGCGATKGYRNEIPLGMDDLVRTAEALVQRLDVTGLTIIGHSMGGLAGLLFTLRNQEWVRRLASVEGNLGPEDCSIYSRRVFQHRFLGRERQFLDDLEVELRRSGATGFDAIAAQLRSQVQERAFFDYCRSIVDYSDGFSLLERFLFEVNVPRLYLHGSENSHLMRIARLRQHGVHVASIPESNHFPVYSNPAAYYRALAEFLAQT